MRAAVYLLSLYLFVGPELCMAQAHRPSVTRLSAAALPLRLERVAVFSGYDLEIGLVKGLIADTHGHVYVLDSQAQEIHVLSRGRAIATIGRRGDGPGEFRDVVSIAWRGDTLLALDRRHRRVSFFGRDGRVIATTSLPAAGGVPVRLYTAGGHVLVLGHVTKPGVPDGRGAFRWPPPDLQYVRLQGDRRAEVLTGVKDTVREPTPFNCEAPNGVIEIFKPLFGEGGPLRAALPDGTLGMASRDRFIIEVVDPNSGSVPQLLVRDMPRLDVRDSDWENETRVYREAEQRHRRLSCDIGAMRPSFLPLVRTVVSDDGGRLWVETRQRDGFRISVLDRRNGRVGEARMPLRDPRVAPFIHGDLLYIVTVDSNDVQSIEVYRTHYPAGS